MTQDTGSRDGGEGSDPGVNSAGRGASEGARAAGDPGDAYRTTHLEVPDGARIATYTWLPQEGARPRALVQIAHGAAEHALRYDRFARLLTAHGYAVVASDHRGHGATAASTGGYGVAAPAGPDGGVRDEYGPEATGEAGTYGPVGGGRANGGGDREADATSAGDREADAWRAIVADLRAVGDRARGEHPGVPLVLLGHSLGSMLARDCAQEYGRDLAGLILSGTFRSLPGAETEGAVDRLEREIARHGRSTLSSYVPELFASFNDPYAYRTGFEWLSRDAAEVDAYVADERCGFPFSAGLSLDWVRAVRKINDPRNLARIPAGLPVHVAVGTEDPCNQGMTLVYELLEDFRYAGIRDLSWKGYPRARHEILNETNRAEVQGDLLAWLEDRVPGVRGV